MRFSPAVLADHARSAEGRKQLRYAGVSAVFVPLGQVIVQVLHWATDLADPLCILITAVILTLPNYWANKNLVWRDTNNDNLRTQVTVFWVAAMLGTGFAMLLAALADRLTEGTSNVTQSIWLFVAQLAGYGTVWIGRYFFLDRWLFKVTRHGQDPTAAEISELHGEFPI
ncbi:MAG: hypothetical protein U0Q22_06050 [Acidimicrobiales bacterium]